MEGNRFLSTEASTPPFDDIITEDAIVSSILSSLPLRQACRTSVLSPRWRHLWIHRRKLNFGARNILDDHTLSLICPDPTPIPKEEVVKLAKEKRDQFIESVNSVLRQRRGRARVEEFMVRYFLKRRHSHHLDAWVRSAVDYKSRVLAFHLYKPLCTQSVKNQYDFPFHLLGSSSVEELTLDCCSLKPPRSFDGLSHLKVLILLRVNVTEVDIVHLLSNCHTLEHLELVQCQQLVTVSVPRPLNRLQELVVKDCDMVTEININAKYLTSLFYWGFPAHFLSGQYSQLKETYVLFKTEASKPSLDFYLNKLSSITSLQSLTFRIMGVSQVPDFTGGGVNKLLFQLKRLEFCWNTTVKMSIPHLATLLGACPNLEELILVLSVAPSGEESTKSLKQLRKKLPVHPHTRLKTTKICDFCYETWHIGLALYLLKNAIQLELMTIKSGRIGLGDSQKEILSKEVSTKNFFLESNFYESLGRSSAHAKKCKQSALTSYLRDVEDRPIYY